MPRASPTASPSRAPSARSRRPSIPASCRARRCAWSHWWHSVGMRAFTAAAVQVAPLPGPLTAESIKGNQAKAADWVTRCVESTGAELVVLPESVTTGFTPGTGPDELWDLVSEVPGPVVEPLQETARRLGVHLVVGTYERGAERGVVHNASVLLGRDGSVAGVYRKTHPFCTEMRSRGGWVTPGEEVSVVETDLGRIGQIICFDGDYPELSRITAVRGAEGIVRPSALLRAADIWELTNRARAYDNHVYVGGGPGLTVRRWALWGSPDIGGRTNRAGAYATPVSVVGVTATAIAPAGVLYFGNWMIAPRVAGVVARPGSHEGWVSARLDPAT